MMKLKAAAVIAAILCVAVLPTSGLAEVDLDVLKTLKISDTPLDVAFANNHNYIYVLTDKGEILVFDPSGRLQERMEVGKQFDQMRVIPGSDVIFLTSRKNKYVQIVQLGFVQQINTSDSPYLGPADAPVVVAVFSEFQ
jgi:hypothetical protein